MSELEPANAPVIEEGDPSAPRPRGVVVLRIAIYALLIFLFLLVTFVMWLPAIVSKH